MSQAYFLGGPPRVGKSTIMEGFIQRNPMSLVSTDAVRGGLKNALFGEPHVSVRGISVEGAAIFKRPGHLSLTEKTFSHNVDMSELTLRAMAGMLDHYDRNTTNVAVEGSVVTPRWVGSLGLSNLAVRAAFVGYSDANHVEAVLDHAAKNPSDWINTKLQEVIADAGRMREWASEQIELSGEIARQAETYGYPYFDVSAQPFDTYVQNVQDYLCAV